jgi:hypothetical protein
MSTTHTKHAAEPTETLERKFHRLEAEWDADTAVLSNPNKIMGHPAMRRGWRRAAARYRREWQFR